MNKNRIPILILTPMLLLTACGSGGVSDTVTDAARAELYQTAAEDFEAGRTAAAIEDYTQLLEENEKDAYAYFLRGTVSLKNGDKKGALADFNSAVEYKEKDLKLYLEIYGSLENAGEDDLAKGYLSRAKDHFDKKAKNALVRGQIDYYLGDLKEAKEELAFFEEKNDLTSESYGLKGDLFAADGEWEQALSAYDTGLAQSDAANRASLLKGKIFALEHTGDFKQAKKLAKSYVKEFPGDEQMEREYIFLKTR